MQIMRNYSFNRSERELHSFGYVPFRKGYGIIYGFARPSALCSYNNLILIEMFMLIIVVAFQGGFFTIFMMAVPFNFSCYALSRLQSSHSMMGWNSRNNKQHLRILVLAMNHKPVHSRFGIVLDYCVGSS